MITFDRPSILLLSVLTVFFTSQLNADQAYEVASQDTDGSLFAVPSDRFVLSGGVLRAQVPVRIDSITVESFDNLLVDELNVAVGDETEITSNTLMISASYFPVPLLEVSVGAGIVSSTSEADLTVSGQFEEPLPILGDEFSIISNTERDNNGYAYNAGAALLIPIVPDPTNPFVLRVGTTFGFNALDNIDTTTVVSSLTLAHTRELFDRNVTLALGATHLDIERVVTFSTSLGGGELNVRQEQSVDNPWSLNSTIVVPLDDSLSTSFTASSNFSGMYSLGLRLSYRF